MKPLEDDLTKCKKCGDLMACITSQDGGLWICQNPNCIHDEVVDSAGNVKAPCGHIWDSKVPPL